MEVDNFAQILDWIVTWIAKSRDLTKELAQEGLVIFYDDLITLHHIDYQKHLRKLLLQHTRSKENMSQRHGDLKLR